VRRTIRSASSRSECPFAGATETSTSNPFRFSVSVCAEWQSRLCWPAALRYSRASGSVSDWCVWFVRFSPRKFTVGLPGSSSSEPSLTL